MNRLTTEDALKEISNLQRGQELFGGTAEESEKVYFLKSIDIEEEESKILVITASDLIVKTLDAAEGEVHSITDQFPYHESRINLMEQMQTNKVFKGGQERFAEVDTKYDSIVSSFEEFMAGDKELTESEADDLIDEARTLLDAPEWLNGPKAEKELKFIIREVQAQLGIDYDQADSPSATYTEEVSESSIESVVTTEEVSSLVEDQTDLSEELLSDTTLPNSEGFQDPVELQPVDEIVDPNYEAQAQQGYVQRPVLEATVPVNNSASTSGTSLATGLIDTVSNVALFAGGAASAAATLAGKKGKELWDERVEKQRQEKIAEAQSNLSQSLAVHDRSIDGLMTERVEEAVDVISSPKSNDIDIERARDGQATFLREHLDTNCPDQYNSGFESLVSASESFAELVKLQEENPKIGLNEINELNAMSEQLAERHKRMLALAEGDQGKTKILEESNGFIRTISDKLKQLVEKVKERLGLNKDDKEATAEIGLSPTA